MSKETQHIINAFISIFSVSSTAAFIVSFIGGRWYTCRMESSQQYDAILSLWKYCSRQNNEFTCVELENSKNFELVLSDFQIIRTMSLLTIITSGLAFVLSIFYCFCQANKFKKIIILMQTIFSIITVILGVSNLFYTCIRAQDIVGENVHYTFGWSCVISWIGTIASAVTVILTCVLTCTYLDSLREQSNHMREELNMDALSITSEELMRISNDSTSASPACDRTVQPNVEIITSDFSNSLEEQANGVKKPINHTLVHPNFNYASTCDLNGSEVTALPESTVI